MPPLFFFFFGWGEKRREFLRVHQLNEKNPLRAPELGGGHWGSVAHTAVLRLGGGEVVKISRLLR